MCRKRVCTLNDKVGTVSNAVLELINLKFILNSKGSALILSEYISYLNVKREADHVSSLHTKGDRFKEHIKQYWEHIVHIYARGISAHTV